MIYRRYGHIDTLPPILFLHFAGACGVDHATWAWMVFEGNNMVGTARGPVKVVKSKPSLALAEWTAVGRGLRWLHDEGWKGEMLTTKGASVAVFNGLTGRDEAEGFAAHLRRCQEIVNLLECKRFSVLLTLAENEPCEGLARMAYTEAEKRDK